MLTFIGVNAQVKNHEIGITFIGFNSVNLIYKKQIGENRFIRHRLFNLSLRLDSDPNAEVFARIGYAFGFEKRKPSIKMTTSLFSMAFSRRSYFLFTVAYRFEYFRKKKSL